MNKQTKQVVIRDIKTLARVYKKMHTGDSEEFVKGFLEGLKNAIAIINNKLDRKL